MILRPYQQDALDALYSYFGKFDGNPLIVLPTGMGKSVVFAEFLRGAVQSWPDTRAVGVTHVRELIQQTVTALLRLWPDAPVGIYSAGLGKKDLRAQIVMAGIQSIYRQAYQVQRCDLVTVDECHLIPRNSDTMYGRFLRELKEINPYMKTVGFTATPFRLDSGMLHKGDGALFHGIAYEMTILEAVQQGYLTEIVPKQTDTTLNVEGVGTRGGEFIAGQLEAAVDIDATTQAAVREIIELGANRRSWLVFAAGVKHAEHIRDAIRAHGITAETVTGDTPTDERDRILRDFKAGRVRSLTNVSVLTTGFDAPGVDLIAMMRPTKSAGLYVQMLGRGTRLIDGAIGNLPTPADRLEAIAKSAKPNCLMLDFAGNARRHGPVDRIKVSEPGKGEGEAPIKVCPDCATICYAGVRVCPDCGHEFPPPEPEVSRAADTAPVLSSQIQTEWVDVDRVDYARHDRKEPNSLRVEYTCGMSTHREWVCFEHVGYARQKACAWWAERSSEPVPATVGEALSACERLPWPARIGLQPDGKYTRIVGYEGWREPDVAPKHDGDEIDDIPF